MLNNLLVKHMSQHYFGAESQIFSNQKAHCSLFMTPRCWLIRGVMSHQFSIKKVTWSDIHHSKKKYLFAALDKPTKLIQ